MVEALRENHVSTLGLELSGSHVHVHVHANASHMNGRMVIR